MGHAYLLEVVSLVLSPTSLSISAKVIPIGPWEAYVSLVSGTLHWLYQELEVI